MAIGLTPKHEEDFHLNDLTKEQFLVLSVEAVKKIEWSIGYLSDVGLIAYTNNGIFASNAEIRIKIENGIANLKSISTGSEMVDWGKNEKNLKKFKKTFDEVKQNLSLKELETKYQELKNDFISDEDNILKQPPATTLESVKDFFSIFKPIKSFFITPVLLDLNILIFILMGLSGVNILLPDNQSLLNWGANFRPITLDGQWWRLITNCFLHIGIIHLLMNMYALLYIGVLLEPILGKTRFIFSYILTGITASVASLWWHDLTISAGASGAIFGMYGVFLSLLTTDLIEKNARKSLLASIGVFVGYNLLYGMKGGIDNAAHIGGLLGGIIIGYAFIPSLKEPDERQIEFSTIILLSLLVLASSFVAYKKIPNDIGVYDTKMKEFILTEQMALEVFSMSKDAPKEELLYGLNERGIYYWNDNLKLLNSFDKMNLPLEIRKRNEGLKEYCELRIKSYELIYKSILEDSDAYDNQIEEYNKQIEIKINRLTGKSK